MEAILFFVALIITILVAMWIFIGSWSVFLLIAAVIFAGYKFLHWGDKETENSEYVERALALIEFTESWSKQGTLFATPECIGVTFFNSDLGLCIRSCLNTSEDREYETAKRNILEGKIAELTGGESGLQRYRELGLCEDLRNHDEDTPVILMYLHVPYSKAKSEVVQLDDYIAALKRRYKKQNKNDLKIYTWLDYNS